MLLRGGPFRGPHYQGPFLDFAKGEPDRFQHMPASTAPNLRQAIAASLPQDIASYADRLALPDDTREAVHASDLLGPAMLRAIEARFVARFGTVDMRIVVSIWSKWHFSGTLVPVLAANLLLDRALPLALDDVAYVIANDGRTAAIRIAHEGSPIVTTDPFERLAPIVFGHLEPLIALLSTHGGVTRRLLWSNAGNLFDALLRKLEGSGPQRDAVVAAGQLLRARHWSDGRLNPFFDAVRTIDEGGKKVRIRRICCLQYLLPDRRLCTACPLPEARHPSRTPTPSGGTT